MLFKVITGKDFFELNPEAKAIPEFERCTARQMDYVALLTDYKTPFRKLKVEDKKYRAALTAGYRLEKDGKRPDANMRNLMDGKVGSVIAAIKVYKALQLDEDYEALLSVSKLISDIRKLNEKEDKTALELDKAVTLTTGKLDKLLETKKKMEELLDFREDPPTTPENNILLSAEDDVVDEGSLSILEKHNQGII